MPTLRIGTTAQWHVRDLYEAENSGWLRKAHLSNILDIPTLNCWVIWGVILEGSSYWNTCRCSFFVKVFSLKNWLPFGTMSYETSQLGQPHRKSWAKSCPGATASLVKLKVKIAGSLWKNTKTYPYPGFFVGFFDRTFLICGIWAIRIQDFLLFFFRGWRKLMIETIIKISRQIFDGQRAINVLYIHRNLKKVACVFEAIQNPLHCSSIS